jgi:hypothetical protein
MRYDRECEDVCKAIISSYDEGLPDLNMDLYVRIWSVRYLSMMRHDAIRAAEIGRRIHASIKTHSLFAYHFHELKHVIGMGFWMGISVKNNFHTPSYSDIFFFKNFL